MIAIHYFLWLIFYSFCGWVYESTLCSVTERRPVNRGFLIGPICPVYGVGAVVTLLFLSGLKGHIPLLFLAGAVLTCTVEYLTAVILEKAFHAKWWDYSHMKFNIQGRVSLLGALVFGLFAVALIEFIHPPVRTLTEQLPLPIRILLSVVFFVLILIDVFSTVRHILRLNGRLEEIQQAFTRFVEHLPQPATAADAIRQAFHEGFEKSRFFSDRIRDLLAKKSFQDRRLFRAFPRLHSFRYNEALQKLRDSITKGPRS